MIVGALPVHFATGESAAALRVDAGDVVREIRGWASEEDLFRALASALQFPDYFGHNWDALEDCLTDLSWLAAEGHVLVFESFHADDDLGVEREIAEVNVWSADPGDYLAAWPDNRLYNSLLDGQFRRGDL